MFRSRSPQRPVLLSPDAPPIFPDPRRGDDEGLVAIGGDLSVARLRAAYAAGIFPWYNDGFPVLWWSPNPRGIVPLDQLRVTRSLRQSAKRYETRVDTCFVEVARACANPARERGWITEEFIEAYTKLHRLG